MSRVFGRNPWLAACLLAAFAVALLAAATRPAAQVPIERELLGHPADLGAARRQIEQLPAETRLFEERDLESTVLLVLDVPVAAEVLERDASWMRVRYGSVIGWVALGDRGAPTDQLLFEVVADYDPERRERRIATARAVLDQPASRDIDLVDYVWITDLPLQTLRYRRLIEVAACIREAHRERYQLGENGVAATLRGPIVLFRRERDYREYVARMGELPAGDTGGHEADGVVVLYAGDRDEEDVAATLAHELVHLQNKAAFAFQLPAWLEEGLAQDFGLAAAGSEGCPRAGAWPRLRTSEREALVAGGARVLRQWQLSGEARSAACAAAAWRGGTLRPRPSELFELSAEELAEPAGRNLRYVTAAVLVRTLLGGDPARRAAFLDALHRRGAGEPVDMVEVVERLSGSWDALAREMVERLVAGIDPGWCDLRVAD